MSIIMLYSINIHVAYYTSSGNFYSVNDVQDLLRENPARSVAVRLELAHFQQQDPHQDVVRSCILLQEEKVSIPAFSERDVLLFESHTGCNYERREWKDILSCRLARYKILGRGAGSHTTFVKRRGGEECNDPQ